jgi:hypothetical protein
VTGAVVAVVLLLTHPSSDRAASLPKTLPLFDVTSGGASLGLRTAW